MKKVSTFVLETEVSEWKSNLKGSASFESPDLDELESHLLDQIDELKTLSLSDREAFMVAVDRIGNKEDLQASYIKEKSLWAVFKIRSSLYLQALLLMICITMTTQIASFVSALIFDYYVLTSKTAPYLYIGTLLLMITLLFFYFRSTYRKSLNPENRISYTGYLTLGLIFLVLVSSGVLFYMTQVAIPQEYFSIVTIKEYLRIAAFLITVFFCIGYSVYEFRSVRVKKAQA